MSQMIDSPIFGTVKKATEAELTKIENLVTEFPVDTFQQLNKKLNKLDLCILIDITEKETA